MTKNRNSTLAIISTLLSILALVVFLVFPMFGEDSGFVLLQGPVGGYDNSKWAKGIMILAYIFVAMVVLDIVLCLIRGVNGKFFKTLSRSATFALGSASMLTFAMYIINVVMYSMKPLLHFMDPFASADGHECHHICLGFYIVIVLILVRIVLQLFAGTREEYYSKLYSKEPSAPIHKKSTSNDLQPISTCCDEPQSKSECVPACECACTAPASAPIVEPNDDLRGRGRSNARAVARNRDIVMSSVNEVAVFESTDIQPVKQLTLAEKIGVLIQESAYHKPMTEREIMDYVTDECDVETKENPLSQSRYVMYKGKAMGFFHTFRDGSWEIVARVEEDFAKALTDQLKTATYSVVPKSPKWIRLPSDTAGNIVRAVIDSSLAETGVVADEYNALTSQQRKRLKEAKKNGIADVTSVIDTFKGVDDVEVKKADKRNYISIKKDGKTLAFVNGKDIDFKLTVKADESRLAYYENSGISVTKATFPTTPGWYTIVCEGNISLDMVKTILNDAYKAN